MPRVLLAERGGRKGEPGVPPGKLEAEPGKSRTVYRDLGLPGLCVEVTRGGHRAYYAWYRVGARPRHVKLGDVGVKTLAEARDDARELLKAAERGIDLVAQRQQAAAEAIAAARRAEHVPRTFKTLREAFIQHGRTKRGRALAASTLELYERSLEELATLDDRPPEEIKRSDIRALIEGLRAKGYETQANRTLQAVRRVFNWLIERDDYGIVTFNPCNGLKVTDEPRRERVLNNDELRSIVSASQGTAIELLLPFILHTAVRSGEARTARWDDFDFEERIWRIPTTKTGVAHTLPLSQGALRILAAAPRTSSPFVFPSHYHQRSKGGHMGNVKYATAQVQRASGVRDWSLHTLRHTVRTRLPELGVLPDIAERILNHALTGIRRVYDHADYVPQKMEALERWSTELERILRAPAPKPDPTRRSVRVLRFPAA